MATVISDAKLQDLMPKSILESDDDLDASWSSGSSDVSQSSESGSSNASAPESRKQNDYCMYEDYFGLNNLVHNIKISDDNPLLKTSTQHPLQFNHQPQKNNWGNSGAAALSAIMNNRSCAFDKKGLEMNEMNNSVDFKQFPPPSMRLSKSMRDHIISGAYQHEINNRNQNTEKHVEADTTSFIPQPHQQPARPGALPPAFSPLQDNIPPPPPPLTRGQGGLHVCVFCRNNGEAESVYTSHVLKDSDGRTSCPILRAYTCPICKSNGDHSHTIKYCPMNQNNRFASPNAAFMGHVTQQGTQGMSHRNYQGQAHSGF